MQSKAEMGRMYSMTTAGHTSSFVAAIFADRVLLANWFNFTVNIIKLDNELCHFFGQVDSIPLVTFVQSLSTNWKIKFNFDRMSNCTAHTKRLLCTSFFITHPRSNALALSFHYNNCLEAVKRTLFGIIFSVWIICEGFSLLVQFKIFI